MEFTRRKEAFVELGRIISLLLNKQMPTNIPTALCSRFDNELRSAHYYNGWFTYESVLTAFSSIAKSLTENKLHSWTSNYKLIEKSNKKIGVILAGNIPLVGFHDFISVLISGNMFYGRLSSQDNRLLPLLSDLLIAIEPAFKQRIFFVENNMKGMDAYIATGSNNSSRYFEYYFNKFPHIIRKNRNSIAVLNGNETEFELEMLGYDIFNYYGMGCRSVSKIYLPESFELDVLFQSLYRFNKVINHTKYANNYDYNKTIYLLNKIPLLDNGFLLLKEDIGLTSPVGVLYYERYDEFEQVKNRIRTDAGNIQCIVSKINGLGTNCIGFGQTQEPELWDYADGIDTISFLSSLR